MKAWNETEFRETFLINLKMITTVKTVKRILKSVIEKAKTSSSYSSIYSCKINKVDKGTTTTRYPYWLIYSH